MPKGDNPNSLVGMSQYRRLQLDKQKLKFVKYLAIGIPALKAGELVNVSHSTAQRWAKDPEMIRRTIEMQDEHRALVEDMLIDSEREAVLKLTELMNACDSDGNPAWEVRLKAVFRSLEMAGRRGKPADVTESKSLALTGNLNEMLANALRDPGVQEFIKQQDIKFLPAKVDNDQPADAGSNPTDTPQSGGSEARPEEVR